MSLFPLPIRLAATSSSTQVQEKIPATLEESTPFGPGPALALCPGGAPLLPLISGSLIAENGDSVSNGPGSDALPDEHEAPSEFRLDAATGSTNHQFWLKDARIAEDLFTVRFSQRWSPRS